MQTSVCKLVRDAEENFTNGTVKIGRYVSWSLYDTLNTIDAYLNSKHTSGSTDSLGREKPFFNICSAAVNVWYRATDIDRKDIRIIAAKNEQIFTAYILQVLLEQWMREENFGVFLNQWGRTLARYGSAVIKSVVQGGELKLSVVPWSRLIVDLVDFDSQATIERFYLTEEQLRADPAYDKEQVKLLLDSGAQQRELRSDEPQETDSRNRFYEIYEVHGKLPLSFLKRNPKKDDETNYVQQMHVISFLGNTTDGYQDFSLYRGREKKHPYSITHLIQEDDRVLGIGAVEYLFDAQWMANHTAKLQKDYLDLASKLIFQTADQNYVHRNVLTNIEVGQIFTHQPNQPLTQVNNSAINAAAITDFRNQWVNLSREITSTPEAVRGETLPSGTPYALGALLTQQASSLFEVMRENKALALEEILREQVIPYLKTKMDTADEISAILREEQIKEIDQMYLPAEAIRRSNEKIKKIILSGGVVTEDLQKMSIETEKSGLMNSLALQGNQRFFKPSTIATKTLIALQSK